MAGQARMIVRGCRVMQNKANSRKGQRDKGHTGTKG